MKQVERGKNQIHFTRAIYYLICIQFLLPKTSIISLNIQLASHTAGIYQEPFF
jgi:hypothetical protein